MNDAHKHVRCTDGVHVMICQREAIFNFSNTPFTHYYKVSNAHKSTMVSTAASQPTVVSTSVVMDFSKIRRFRVEIDISMGEPTLRNRASTY